MIERNKTNGNKSSKREIVESLSRTVKRPQMIVFNILVSVRYELE